MPIVAPAAHVEIALASLPEHQVGELVPVLQWVAGFGEGDTDLEVSRHGLQRFLWYALPRKWDASLEEQLAVAESLASFFEVLPRESQGDGYAELCRSAATREQLELCERDEDAGVERFLAMEVASGVEPPDVPAFAWGGVMGIEEATLRAQASVALEAAMEMGELHPGKARWRQSQERIVERFLRMSRDDLGGRTPLEVIEDERIENWRAASRDQEAAMAERVWSQIAEGAQAISAGDENEVAAPLSWLLTTADADGSLKLTQTGCLSRALVEDAAERFPDWWEAEIFGPPRREAELAPLEGLHDLCRREGLLRRNRGRLLLTPAGRACLADPTRLADVAARGILDEGFETALTVPILASLLLRDGADVQTLAAGAHPIVAEQGWSRPGGVPIRVGDLMIGVSRALGRAEALGAIARLSLGTVALTEDGRRLAARALWLHVTGPREWA